MPVSPFFNTRSLCAFLLSLPLILGAAETKFGHHRYPLLSEKELKIAGNYRETGRVIKLHPDAAEAFVQMVAAAKNQNTIIVPISGHRTKKYQENLFKNSRKRHNRTEEETAHWVAPVGFSEHHTGYALDLGDGNAPTTDIEQSFEDTAAFRWLTENAATYHFELSFPRNNPQGIGYEPWHWRFVGTTESQKLFHPQEK